MALRSEIDEVRTRIDIVDVIQQFTSLKKAGKDYRGLCPFHNEKTPSFHVYPEMARWRCFGQCGVGGDVFEFLQKIEGLSFPEALERLAAQSGVTLTVSAGAQQHLPGEISERDKVVRVNQLAVSYYCELLSGSDRAIQYMLRRGIGIEAQKAFSLGYAGESWDGLALHLRKNGASLIDAETAGLVGRRDTGGHYDRVRDRIVFPIFDVQNRPIGFGARLIDASAENQPKYWNSPETPVFSKSKTLYGLSTGRRAIADAGNAIVVEGYTDVIACQSAGFGNVVATLGTSLTEEHVKVLRRLASTVLLCFDADSAGLKAAYRAAELFERHDITVKVIDLPSGDDPDSLIRAGKTETFAKAVQDAYPLVEYQLKQLAKTWTQNSEQGRLELLQLSMAVVATISSEIERDRYVGMIAQLHPRFRFGSAAVELQIRTDVAGLVRARRKTAGNNSRFETNTPVRAVVNGEYSADQLAEIHILRALVSDDIELVRFVLNEVSSTDFMTEIGTKTAAFLLHAFRDDKISDRSSILKSVAEPEIADLIGSMLISEEPVDENVVKLGIEHLKMRSFECEAAELKNNINAGAADATMLQRYTALMRMLKGLNQSNGGTRGK